MTHLLSVYGIAGLTAYFGLLKVACRNQARRWSSRPRRARSVPRGQIAKIKGCRVVGIAGGAGQMPVALAGAGLRCGRRLQGRRDLQGVESRRAGGIDVYFDNVGGDILEACLAQMNIGGRISCCGAISAYDGPAPAAVRAAFRD